MAVAILFAVFAVLLVLGVPVAFALIASSLATVLYLDIPAIVVVQQTAAGATTVSLIAIPLFIFADELMMRGGISFQIAISRSSLSSFFASSPDAVAMISRMNSSATASASSPLSTLPASKSIQCGLCCASVEFELIFSVGAGKPSGVPRPVVNSTTVAPAATRAVDETPSLPGASSKVRPASLERSP